MPGEEQARLLFASAYIYDGMRSKRTSQWSVERIGTHGHYYAAAEFLE